MRTLLLLASAVAALGCKSDEPKSASTPPPHPHASPVDITDPEACATCHPAIVDEWRGSMHARAHHSRDPIYAGVRALRMSNEGEHIAKACAGCHTPGFEKEPDAPAAAVGVGCATCHNARVDAAPGVLLGPSDVAAGATVAHGTGPAHPALADGTSVCLTCHASLDSPKGLSMCATGAEHAALPGDPKASCASCHMPRVAGAPTVHAGKTDHATHAFLGPHHAWYQGDPTFTASAIEVTATLAGRKLRVAIANVSGHSFPTGFPGRGALIECIGRDAGGADVWRCEPRALTKIYVDAAGAPTLAPFAEKLASDTRLAPGATETFELDTPPSVATVDVVVSLRLIPPPLAAKLALADAPEGTPRELVRVTATAKTERPAERAE